MGGVLLYQSRTLLSCSRLVLGFMVSCAFLSMWLSNTSAAAMVMPIVEAVAQQIIKAETEADALEMSCSNGSINPTLELDGRHTVQLLSLLTLILQWSKHYIKYS